MEPWEALDLDDSELPFLLRPCKRQIHNLETDDHSHKPSQPQKSQIPVPNFSILLPSQTPPSRHSPHSQLHRHTPFEPPLPPPPLSSENLTSRPIIPGPAGAIQATMFRKDRAIQNHAASRGDSDDTLITTQEYIRMAVEAGEADDDFNRNPWLSALELLDQQGVVDGGPSSTPLNSIKKYQNIGRVDQVVAIIKLCTPNGLGDLIAILKDPTGTIDASIHHKVLADVELGKDISVGSVLILRKVAVFAPSRSAHYLNITLSNVAKVISKDSGPLIKQNYPVWTIKPVPCRGYLLDTCNIHKVISLELDRTEAVVDDVRQNVNMRNPEQRDKLIEPGNPNQLIGHCRNENGTLGAVKIMKKDRIDCIDDEQRGLIYVNILQTGGQQPSSLQYSSSGAKVVESQNDQEIPRINGTRKQRQALISKSSIPEWTDEQLHELFAADSEDGGSLYLMGNRSLTTTTTKKRSDS